MFFRQELEGQVPWSKPLALATGISYLRHLDEPPAKEEREADLIDLYVTVADMDRLYSEMVGRGAKIVYGPVEQEYGMKEFYVEDCNGYRLAFGQPTEGN